MDNVPMDQDRPCPHGEWLSECVGCRIADLESRLESALGESRANYNAAERWKEVAIQRQTDSIDLAVENNRLREALEKIADPRKRDHKEPDAYTELGCVMNIANEALRGMEAGKGGEK